MTVTAPLLRMPVGRAVWSVAWPMVLLGLLRSAYFLVDAYWVGGLGPEALAALGGCAFAWWIVLTTCGLASHGVHALIARAEGAGSRAAIPEVLAQGLWVAVTCSAVVAALWPVRHLYVDLIGFDAAGDAHRLGAEFLGASLLGAGTAAVHWTVDAVFRALGNTRTALVITACTLVANAVLDPLFIFGVGALPGLGIAGAAWATAAATGLGALIGLGLLARMGMAPARVAPDAGMARRIVAIGLPVASGRTGFSVVYVILGGMITDFGDHQMAALGVGHRLESVAYLFSVGMSVGAATLVGQALGAGRPDHARRATRAAAMQCSAAMLLFCAGFMVLAPSLMGLFTDDPATAAAGAVYLRIQSAVMLFMGLESVYDGAFTGSGDTRPPFVIGLTLTTARIPLAWLLAHGLGWGIEGIWLAIAASTVLKAVALWAQFRQGGWIRALDGANA